MVKADFSKCNHLFLSYPKKFSNEYEVLVPFYDRLIEIIPNDIHLFIICNSKVVKQYLERKFSHKNIDVIVINYWDELWLRDCLGLVASDAVYQFKYSPNYCLLRNEAAYYKHINKLSKRIITETLTSNIIEVPLYLDGGNFVHNTQKSFLTSKVYEDNLGVDVENIIKDYLGLEAAVVNKNPLDVIGHTDGYMSFKDESTLFVSRYPNGPYLKKDIEYVDMLKAVGIDNGFNVLPIFDNPSDEQISCACKQQKNRSCLYSAKGLYINSIRFNEYIIMPEYTSPNNSLLEYNWMNKKWLESLGFKVIGINCDQLAQFGGSLHCISFQA